VRHTATPWQAAACIPRVPCGPFRFAAIKIRLAPPLTMGRRPLRVARWPPCEPTPIAMTTQLLKRSAGFSLVELMIAVIIMGLLTAIALPIYMKAETRI
jgi:prepilin-type N-terminal cleavage/methylation domain-containing protein